MTASAGALVSKEGEVALPPPAPRLSVAPKADMGGKAWVEVEKAESKPKHPLAFLTPPVFIGHLTVSVLSCFIGYIVIWGVSYSLRTPLMSVTT